MIWPSVHGRNLKILRNISATRRHLLTVCALGLLFLVVTISGFFATLTATNNVEHQRSIRLAEAAINSQKAALGTLSEDNAWWDEAALEIYVNGRTQAFFEESWADYTVDNPSYDMVALVDERHNVIAATEKGKAITLDIRNTFGKGAVDIIAKLTLAAPSGQMLVVDEQGLSVVAVSMIRHTDNEKNPGLIGGKPRILLLKKHLAEDVIHRIAMQYNVSGLRYHTKRVDEDSFPLNDGRGEILGYLSWDAPTAGFAAAKNSLPILLIGSLLFFIALSFGARLGLQLLNSLSDQAYTDSLSGMPNRRALRSAIREEQTKSSPHALALIDLDGFKYVNDSFGHAVGDQLIKQIAEMLNQQVGGGGVVARLGGDEFAILLAGGDAKQRIQTMSNQFLKRLSLPIMIEDRALSIGASIGLAATASPLKDEGELLRRADISMYQAKRLGKMQVQWYDPQLDDEQSVANAMATELRHSLSIGDLTVVYQPIVEADDQRCGSVEALARWTSPTRGPIPPDTFIPIAENTGMIDAIGLFVLRRACTDLSSWPDIKLAVNVSSAQLRNPMFPHELQAILNDTAFNPTRLELEITETYLIADASLARKVIEGVAALGVTISLDDFGTGYASIGFLRQFSFGKLKIDRSLVKDAQYDEAARMLVQVSVAAARALNMLVTAEGVETSAQADLMKIAGCDQLQGWYFGRPIEYDALAAMLTETPGRTEAVG
jgi:diguanylate cyclase (GGDEF)-like protein